MTGIGSEKNNTRYQCLYSTHETAEVFGSVKNSLMRAGTPLPIIDVWIAAHGVETGAVIISYDAHFNKISGLRRWEDF